MSLSPPDRIKQINAALEETKGNKVAAAELLGMHRDNLWHYLRTNKDLRARWVTDGADVPTPPTEIAVLDRTPEVDSSPEAPPSDSMIPVSDVQAAEALERESRRLRAGLSGLGLNESEMEIAMNLQAFHNQNFKNSLEIIGASVTVTTIKLQTQQRAIELRLQDVRNNLSTVPDYDPETISVSENFSVIHDKREKWVKEEAELVKQYVQIGQLLRQNLEIANKGAMTMALIRHRFGKGGMKKAKPGFTTEAMEA